MTQAAVLYEFGGQLEVRDIYVLPPQAGEVRVKLAASGVCHSDQNAIDQSADWKLPIVLGHEGAGVVTEVGEGVTRVALGDHVVLSAVPRCGLCPWCLRGQFTLCVKSSMRIESGQLDGTSRLRLDGKPLHQFCFSGTFAEETVAPEISVVKIPSEVPLDRAALIGCGVVTGWGAAVRTAHVGRGDTVAVVGCGGVGLNAVQAARHSGAERVIAVDLVAWKLELAKTFGATDVVLASETDPVAAVQELTGGDGVDTVIEVVGISQTIKQAIDMTRRGGQCVLVGVPRPDALIAANALVWAGKRVLGCLYGFTDIYDDFPMLADLYSKGELLLDELVTSRISLTEINAAFDAMAAGEVARSLVVY